MKNIKLLPKLLGGFVIVALIVLVVGYVGLSGARALNANILEIGKLHLSGIKNLLLVAEAQSRVDSAENSLLDRSLDEEGVQGAFKEFDDSKKVIDDSLNLYEGLPKSKEERVLWNSLKPAMDTWWKSHQDFAGLARTYWGNPSDASYSFMQNQMPVNDQAFSASNALLHELVAVNDKEANAAVEDGSATGTRVQMVAAIGMGAGVVLALVLGILLALSITRPVSKGVSFAELVASGDFTQTLQVRRKDEVGKLADALNSMVEKLKGMVASIQDSAQQVASSSEEISASAIHLAEGAQSQASTLEETSASVEELTASVDQVSEHAQSQAAAVEQGSSSMTQVHTSIEDVSKSLNEIAELAGQSVHKAAEGAKAVQEVVEGIGAISSGSERIGGIVTVISDIADQTNLLALNASIEAARAGEHGRGFAVVADEVSKLADRSSASAKEIESLIKDSIKNVNRGVETAMGSQAAMEQIRSASEKVKEMIAGLSSSMAQQVGAVRELSKALQNVNEMSQSISAAAEEQTGNAKQVSKAVESVNEITQAAASSAEEMSSATEQLSGLAQQLQKMVEQFKLADDEGLPTPGQAERGNGNRKRQFAVVSKKA